MKIKHPPTEMYAWTYSERGLPTQVLTRSVMQTPKLPPKLPLPRAAPKPEEWILVKVAQASLNPAAVYQMTLTMSCFRAKQSVPDMELSGVVVDVWHPSTPAITLTPADDTDTKGDCRDSRTRFNPGDHIVALLPEAFTIPTGTGALAEYVTFPARYAVHAKLETVSMLAGLTARQLVIDSGLKEGDTVLVNAASGGVGSLAVQLARRVVGPEAKVIAVCSGKNGALVRSLGADKTWDYEEWDVPAVLWTKAAMEDVIFDVILDCRGDQELFAQSRNYLAEDGVYASVGVRPASYWRWDCFKAACQNKMDQWWPVSRWLLGYGRVYKGIGSMLNPSVEDREAVVDMLKSLKVIRDSTWEFEEVQAAYFRVQTGHAAGKIVVKVSDDE